MRGLLIILLSLMANLVLAQSKPLPEPARKWVVTGGIWSSNSLEKRANLRVGLQSKRQCYLIGIHRLLRFGPQKVPLYLDRYIQPWPVGLDFWFRHYFAIERTRWNPYFLLSMTVSRSDMLESPRFHLNPKRLGSFMYFEPTVGYGMRWQAWESLFVTAEVGAGLNIGQYFPAGQRPEPGYWPGSFMGMISLEKHF